MWVPYDHKQQKGDRSTRQIILTSLVTTVPNVYKNPLIVQDISIQYYLHWNGSIIALLFIMMGAHLCPNKNSDCITHIYIRKKTQNPYLNKPMNTYTREAED